MGSHKNYLYLAYTEVSLFILIFPTPHLLYYMTANVLSQSEFNLLAPDFYI